jgi:LCP family protein required for cell wall assembly
MEEKRGEELVLEPAPIGEGVEKTLYAPVLVASPGLGMEFEKIGVETIKKDADKLAPKPKKPFRWARAVMISILLFSFTLLGLGGYVLATKALNSASKTTGESAGDILGGLFKGFTDSTIPLLGQTEGRTNFLIIGVDGSGYLADSISLVSYFYDTKEFSSIHIPRDMSVKSQYGRTKINEFFSYAEQTGDRNGPKELQELLENELAIKLHYWVQFNFAGVTQLVDAVGGVDVDIPNTFTDCDYPQDQPGVPGGCIKFTAGTENMDGTRALIFARSRHSWDNAAEGSDFARGKRQSIIMESLLRKMLSDAKSKGGLFDTKKLSNYLDVLGENVRVSIKTNELKSFYDTFYKQVGGLNSVKFTKISWDTSSSLFTSAFSTPEAYVITYYDGQMIGDGQPSKARTEARNQIQDPRAVGKNGTAKKASLIVLGNDSGKAKLILDETKKLGFSPCAQCYDDGYPKIKVNKDPKATVYISDSTIREEATDLLKNATFPYTIESVLPSTKILTPNNQGVDIVIWIE